MCYCGPAMHALFNSSTRMADDNDFIKSGTVDVGGLGVGMCTFFFVPFPIQYVHEFQYDMFRNRDGRNHQMRNRSHPVSS